MIKIPAKQISFSKSKRGYEIVRFIAIHYTGVVGDTAENEGKFFANGNTRAAGAHFFIDQAGQVVKSVDLNRAAWSVGGVKYPNCNKTGGGKYYGIVTNANSVSIELCDNVNKSPSKKQIKAVKNTIKYIRKHCPNAKTVVRHFDVTGKPCPGMMTNDATWKNFKKEIGEA